MLLRGVRVTPTMINKNYEKMKFLLLLPLSSRVLSLRFFFNLIWQHWRLRNDDTKVWNEISLINTHEEKEEFELVYVYQSCCWLTVCINRLCTSTNHCLLGSTSIVFLRKPLSWEKNYCTIVACHWQLIYLYRVQGLTLLSNEQD